MLRKYYDADVDWSRIADKTVAVIGYGSQGRAQAANLRDSGLAVIVGVRPGRSLEAASLDGFTTMPVADAVRKADVLDMLVPD
ncbi:MAG TPA: NAD(P)-dependent oxidoreductase, partial [Methanocorpusculum sp.]|nr:NAD(P)-dependent oxidoreductase [Methanocorpusculum sp.]